MEQERPGRTSKRLAKANKAAFAHSRFKLVQGGKQFSAKTQASSLFSEPVPELFSDDNFPYQTPNIQSSECRESPINIKGSSLHTRKYGVPTIGACKKLGILKCDIYLLL